MMQVGGLMQVTVSTVGLVPQLRHFVENSPAQLAVSLHATTDEVCFMFADETYVSACVCRTLIA